MKEQKEIRLQDCFHDLSQWLNYSAIHDGLVSKMGFSSAEEAWEVNPLITKK